MAPVLLGMAWLDALDVDAEPEPPDRQFGEVIEAVGARERQAVVGSDGLGQAAFFEEPLEGREGTDLLG